MKLRAFWFDQRGRLVFGEVAIEGGVVASLRTLGDTTPPADAPYLLSGLCDIHTHGNSGFDFSDGNYDGLVEMARFLYRRGVTRFCPTTMALPEQKLMRMCQNAKRLHDEPVAGCAKLVGINLEGPFFSYEKRGAQCADYLINPDYELYTRLQRAAGGLIKIVCVAPELAGAMDFIGKVSKEACVSLAHTDCGYDTAAEAIRAGARHVTHLYNAMRPMHHRAPGLIPAAAEDKRVTAELICDGLHVHPAMVRTAYQLFGKHRLCLVSDAMAACGMEDGEYALGSQRVFVRAGRATLAQGTIAGSTATLWDCLKNAVSFGIPLADAARMASANPLCAVGQRPASVCEGEQANLVLCNGQFELMDIYA